MVYFFCMTLSDMGHWVPSSAKLGERTPWLKRQVCLTCSHICLLCVMDRLRHEPTVCRLWMDMTTGPEYLQVV